MKSWTCWSAPESDDELDASWLYGWRSVTTEVINASRLELVIVLIVANKQALGGREVKSDSYLPFSGHYPVHYASLSSGIYYLSGQLTL